MNKTAKTMTYAELKKINDRGEVDNQYVGFDIYKNGDSYMGTIIRISSERIVVDTSGCYRHKDTKKNVAGVAI